MSSLGARLTFYGDPGFSRFLRMAFAWHTGLGPEDYDKPVIGICDTTSEINRCHTHFGPLIDAVKHGILMEGGIPVSFPTISLGTGGSRRKQSASMYDFTRNTCYRRTRAATWI